MILEGIFEMGMVMNPGKKRLAKAIPAEFFFSDSKRSSFPRK
jgi:hypothetical protein